MMNATSHYKHCAALVVVLMAVPLCAVAAENEASPERPNIVFFLTDDQGWQDTSVPFHTQRTPLNDFYRTPNMERLAARGVKFTAAYACPLCSPTRVSIMTGENAARHAVTQWTLYKDRDQSRNDAKFGPPKWQVNGLQPRDATLPNVLRKHGYRTIHVGKAHFGADGTPGEDPRNHGFDVNIAGHCAGGPGSYHGTNNFSAAFRKAPRIWDVPGLEKYHGKDINLTEALTIEANAAVKQAVADGKPFYLYMSHYAVHAPYEPDKRFLKRYLDQGVKGRTAVYASMVESMDHSLGKILDKLEELGVAEKTIVLFASDNGGIVAPALPQKKAVPAAERRSHGWNWPLRSHKCSPYEGGIRVPMIVAWAKPNAANPHQKRLPIRPGSTCGQPVFCDDWLPTISRFAGVENVDALFETLDGYDVTPCIVGDESFRRNGPIVVHYPHVYAGGAPHSAMRDGNWKLIYFYRSQHWELYDLSNDLSEKHNLATKKPEMLKPLAEELVKLLNERGAKYPVEKATGKEAVIRVP